MLTAVIAVLGAVVFAVLVRVARRVAIVDRTAHLGARRSLLPASLRARVDRSLDAAGLELDADAAVRVWCIAAIGAGAAGLLGAPALAGAGVVLVTVGAPVGLWCARHRHAHGIERAVPGVVERTATELRGAGTVGAALLALASSNGPLAPDFGRLEARVGLGASTEAALAAWADERPLPSVRAAAGALALAASTGGPAADALDGFATALRDREAVRAEARAQTAQARLSAVVVGLLPVGTLAVQALTDPGAVRALVATPTGRACALGALVCEVLAAVWMRRILHEEP